MRAGEHKRGGTHQFGQERGFTIRQLHLNSVGCGSTDPPGNEVKPQSPGLQHRRRIVAAAHQRPDPGQQFGNLERLDQIVLGPGVETFNPVLDRSAGGEDQRGRGDSARSQHCHQFGTIHDRQTTVADHRVEVAGQAEVQALLSVERGLDPVALAAEQVDQHGAQRAIVLDEQ